MDCERCPYTDQCFDGDECLFSFIESERYRFYEDFWEYYADRQIDGELFNGEE